MARWIDVVGGNMQPEVTFEVTLRVTSDDGLEIYARRSTVSRLADAPSSQSVDALAWAAVAAAANTAVQQQKCPRCGK